MRSGWRRSSELRTLVPAGATMAPFALRWILMSDAVTVVIPGAKNDGAGEGQLGRGRPGAALGRRDGGGEEGL